VSHGHSGWGAYHPGQVMSLGADRFRPQVYGRILDGAEAAVRSALASLAPARIGLGIQDGWDPQRRIYDDRRPQNDGLPEDDGGAVGSTRDERLWILRVDNDSGPLAAVVSFGFHGNIAREVNALASIEAGGLVELELQERLGPGVVVMHALSAAGDADATGVSSLPPCEVSPCADFAQMESVGQLAADTALALHASIETSDRVGLSFASRTVALGRDLEIREGALRYAPADAVPDRVVWTADGAIANPIDEFAAPDGAALCGGATPDLPLSPIDGVEDLSPWGTCVDLSLATGILTALFGTQPGGTPFCETVRTVVGGLRLADIPLLTIGADGTQAQSDAEDVLVATLPGEPVSLWARTFRERSPRGPERTLLLGYAQDYVGYLLSAEDWMSGGFEPSINVWGPLEGEFLMEHALALAFDLTADTAPEKRPAVDRVAWTLPTEPDWTPQPGTAPGTIPKELPEGLVVGVGTTPAGAQPNPTIRRVVDTATFVFEGHDPLAETPTVVLEFESPTGFEPVRDTSGRPLDGHAPELLLTYTPDPLTGDGPRRHLYAVQWQAVAPLGSALEDASGVAAGTYRFRVDGSGYSLVSDAFAVVGDGSLTVEVERDGDSASGRVFFEVRGGYRLLRLDGASEGEVSVVGEVSVAGTTVLLGPGGGFILNAPGGGGVVVVDRFGNRGVE
jgi:neutral ceramidase